MGTTTPKDRRRQVENLHVIYENDRKETKQNNTKTDTHTDPLFTVMEQQQKTLLDDRSHSLTYRERPAFRSLLQVGEI